MIKFKCVECCFYAFIYLENEKLIDTVISYGGDVNGKDISGFTPLMCAVNQDGNIE